MDNSRSQTLLKMSILGVYQTVQTKDILSPQALKLVFCLAGTQRFAKHVPRTDRACGDQLLGIKSYLYNLESQRSKLVVNVKPQKKNFRLFYYGSYKIYNES